VAADGDATTASPLTRRSRMKGRVAATIRGSTIAAARVPRLPMRAVRTPER